MYMNGIIWKFFRSNERKPFLFLIFVFLLRFLQKLLNKNTHNHQKYALIWTYGKTPLKDMTISQQITSILDEAQTKLNSKYVMLMEQDTLKIRKKENKLVIFLLMVCNVNHKQKPFLFLISVFLLRFLQKLLNKNTHNHQKYPLIEKFIIFMAKM